MCVCKQRSKRTPQAWKQMEVWTAPKVLMVHFKRFSFTQGWLKCALCCFVELCFFRRSLPSKNHKLHLFSTAGVEDEAVCGRALPSQQGWRRDIRPLRCPHLHLLPCLWRTLTSLFTHTHTQTHRPELTPHLHMLLALWAEPLVIRPEDFVFTEFLHAKVKGHRLPALHLRRFVQQSTSRLLRVIDLRIGND